MDTLKVIFTRDIVDLIKPSEEYKKILKRCTELYNEIEEILTKEQFELFEKFCDNHLDLEAEDSETHFRAGVKFGMRFAAQCLTDE